MQRCSKHGIYIGKSGCKICNQQSEYITSLENEVFELQSKLSKYENEQLAPDDAFYLSANDLNAVRGLGVSIGFMYMALKDFEKCLNYKQSNTKAHNTFQKLIKIIEKQHVSLRYSMGILIANMQEHNWERMKKEIQKIADLSVETLNNRSLGDWDVKRRI